MDKWAGGLLTVVRGRAGGLQAPINSTLGKSVGTFAAAVALVRDRAGGAGAIAAGGGRRLRRRRRGADLKWYYLIGGVLGAVYVTTVLGLGAQLGAGGVTAATIAGQLTCRC